MRELLTLAAGSLLLAQVSAAQAGWPPTLRFPTPTSAPTYAGTWSRTLGDAGKDDFVSVRPTLDNGGYLLTGSTAAAPGTGWLVKLEPDGGVRWQRSYSGLSIDSCDSSGTGWVLGGTDSQARMGVCSLGSDGSVLWSQRFDSQCTSATIGGSGAVLCKSTFDGGALAARTELREFGYFNLTSDIRVYRLDQAGQLLWQRTLALGTSGLATQEFLRDLEPAGDGGAFVLGQADGVPLLVRLDVSGAVLWARLLLNGGEAVRMSPTSDGGVLVAGGVDHSSGQTTRDAIWLARVGPDGSPIWQATLHQGGLGEDYRLRDMAAGAGGSQILVGEHRTSGPWDAFALLLDPGGAVLWARSYGGPLDDRFFGVESTSVKDWVVCGESESFDPVGQEDAWVARVDRNGEITFLEGIGAQTSDLSPALTVTSDPVAPIALAPDPCTGIGVTVSSLSVARSATSVTVRRQTVY